MRLLILTQAVDLDDPVLGFFHRWIEELAKGCEHVHVICLQEGRHALPSNVEVHSLGKESGRSRFKYVTRFYRYITTLRSEYDTVFVHMNSEYVVLGGVCWRLWGKRVVLWRNHVLNGYSTWLAAHLSHAVCYTSPSAYTAQFKNSVRMPIGIDTDLFAPAARMPPQSSILFFGRLDEVKHPDVFLQALERLHERGVAFHADIVGDPTYQDSPYARALRDRATTLMVENVLSMHPGVRHSEAPALFGNHAFYVNLTPSGSFDKTIGEAMASGTIVICSNDAVRGVVPERLMAGNSAEQVAGAIGVALELSTGERTNIALANRTYVEREHSLSLLVRKLCALLRSEHNLEGLQ